MRLKRRLPLNIIIPSVITLRRELAARVSRRGDSKAVNTESQILLRIIYRHDFGEYGSGARAAPSYRSEKRAFLVRVSTSDIEERPISCRVVLK